MSSSPPAPATENDELVETVEIEASHPGHTVESAGTEADAGATANQTVSSPHEEANALNDDPDVYYEDTDDEHDVISSDDDDTEDDVVSDVDDDFDEEGGKFSESLEVEATVEALWRKVVAVEEKPSAGHACSLCMEPLTCEGAHRICCIPCGHVYGRSCLDQWLRRNADETARCPQCAMMFADNHIINLYAPGNLWEGCGRVQEVKVYVTKAMAEVMVQCEGKMAKLKAEHSSSYQQVYEKVRELKDLIVQAGNERLEQWQSLNDAVDKACTKMNYIIDVKCAEIDMIKQHIAAGGSGPSDNQAEQALLLQ